MNNTSCHCTLYGVFLGGVISLVASLGTTLWLINAENIKQLKAEKRQKLELFMENVIKQNHCIFGGIANLETFNECKKDASLFRITILQELYFPELKNETNDFVLTMALLEKNLMQCNANQSECIKSKSDNNGRKEYDTMKNKVKLITIKYQ